jgi:prepilin-type N-terminal cleavage/methylation domain-containing protein
MCPKPAIRRGGYTLIELLLAVALLAVLVGITVPSALRLYADSQLSEAAELVRQQVAGARIRAIDSGLIYQFRYEPDGRRFIVCPFERETEASNDAATGTGVTTGVGKFTKFAGELPDGFRFIACCIGTTATGQQVAEEFLDGLPNAGDLASVAWSPPITFAPDGTAVDAAFEVEDPRKYVMRFEVRGLTGAVKFYFVSTEAAP